MPASDKNSFFIPLLVIGGGIGAGVIAGLVYVPPYFANREVRTAVASVLDKADPTLRDDQLIAQINTFLMDAKTSRYWVEDNKQMTALDFKMSSDKITFSREGNRHISADVDYTQTMWVPVLNKVKELRYAYHVEPQ